MLNLLSSISFRRCDTLSGYSTSRSAFSIVDLSSNILHTGKLYIVHHTLKVHHMWLM